jgi:hypothetical protein
MYLKVQVGKNKVRWKRLQMRGREIERQQDREEPRYQHGEGNGEAESRGGAKRETTESVRSRYVQDSTRW